MRPDYVDHDWQPLSEEILNGIYEWRLQHAHATLSEIEAAIDERLARLRAQLLQDAALATSAADWAATPVAEHPTCPQCGTPLRPRGTQTRTLLTHGGRDLVLERSYGVCPACQAGLFPPG
jgi:YgiT-type zinc finger domain-containing protein